MKQSQFLKNVTFLDNEKYGKDLNITKSNYLYTRKYKISIDIRMKQEGKK
jgi:hypothetical protein